MTAKEVARCAHCQEPLAWLGSQTQRTGQGSPVTVVHWICPGCGRRWVHHSERGWRETNVDLTAD
jgi:RNase P subunit RPR2